MDFKKFKKDREKLSKSVSKIQTQKPSYVDERFWTLPTDKSKVGEAVIRFLPQKDASLAPIVETYKHGFDLKGKWFWENCPYTINQDCPVCDWVQPLWDEDTKASKAKAGKFARKRSYIANILVVNDIAKPENNGKVFLFRFGVGIYKKIMAKLAPESEIVKPTMIHDMWEGRDFHLKSTEKVTGDKKYANYDTSEFMDDSTPVAKTDTKIEDIYNLIKGLNEFIDPKIYKPYDEIAERFNAFMKLKKARLPESDIDDDAESTKEKEENTVSDVINEKKEDNEDDFDISEDDFEMGDNEDDIPF